MSQIQPKKIVIQQAAEGRILLGNHTLREREEYIRKHMAVCERTERRKRYNNKSSGPAPKGTMSVRMAQRKCATKKWKLKVKRELAREAGTNSEG